MWTVLSLLLPGIALNFQLSSDVFAAAESILIIPSDIRTADMPDSWLVLYNLNDADSITWKDWYVEQWGIPQENTLGLNVSTSEHLATAEIFNATIYTPVRSYLMNNTALENKIMGILVGYHVPGNFGSPENSGGGGYSVASRLQYLDYALSGYYNRKTNPFLGGYHYTSGTMTRFTKNNMPVRRYLAARLDGPNLAAVEALTLKAQVLSTATVPLPANQSLYYDYHDPGAPGGDDWAELKYAVQNYLTDHQVYPWLEWDSETSPTPNSALRFSYYRVSGWNTMNWGGTPAGSRILGMSSDSWGATTVRSTTNHGGRFGPNALFTGGFAAVCAATDEPWLSGIPKVWPIVQSLKNGWTVAEACCYASYYIDWMFECIGDPLLQIPYWFNTTGNNSPPILSNPAPAQNATGGHAPLRLSIDIADINGDPMTLRWYSNSSGTWRLFGLNSSASNGTYRWTNTNFSSDHTTYWWMVYCTDGHGWTNQLYRFTTYTNQSPVASTAVPANQSTGVPTTTSSLSVMITDPESDHFTWTISTSPSIGNTSGINETNGTKTCTIAGLQYSTIYHWIVSSKDTGSGQWTNQSFWFTTESEPSNDPPPSGGGGYTPPSEPIQPIRHQNNPPTQPQPPTGPIFIERGISYSYSSIVSDPDEDHVRIRFDWGDGTYSNWTAFVASNISVSASHLWSNASTYEIRALAQDENGSNSSWSQPLLATISGRQAADNVPIPHINASTNAMVNQSVVFDASGSVDPLEVIISYFWEFGDGTNGSGKNLKHSYQKAGTYAVNLTITDTTGKIYTKTMRITVAGLESPVQQTQPLFFYGGIILIVVIIGAGILFVVRRKK
jgi:uncharacterized protein (TIGR03790 family)